MKALVITRFGGLEVLELQQVTAPQPSPEQVLVNVGAGGLNFADLMTTQGGYATTPKPPLTAGREFGVMSPLTWRLGDLFAKHAFLLKGLGWGSMPLPDLIAALEKKAPGMIFRTDQEPVNRPGNFVINDNYFEVIL